jgi:hypothetical protein
MCGFIKNHEPKPPKFENFGGFLYRDFPVWQGGKNPIDGQLIYHHNYS